MGLLEKAQQKKDLQLSHNHHQNMLTEPVCDNGKVPPVDATEPFPKIKRIPRLSK